MILLEHIKEDWLYRLPYRLDNMKFRGLNRPAYTLICLVYYSIKSIILLYFAVLVCGIKFIYLFPKFIFWDIWNWMFKIDQTEWFQNTFYAEDEEDDDEEDHYCEEYDEDINEPVDDAEDISFCQLFSVGPDMCLLVDHVEMCPDETAYIRVADDEGYTPLYKRKVRRDKTGDRFIVFNNTNYYLDDAKTQPVIRK